MNNDFPHAPDDIPFITEEQMREVDRAMVDDFGVTLLQMMENAGRNLAEVAHRRFLSGAVSGKHVLVVAGPGGNGGGGLAAARHLHNAGANVEIILASTAARMSGATEAQLNTLNVCRVRISIFEGQTLPQADLLIDAVFGYGMRGDPGEPEASLIHAINVCDCPVLSNDIPSGIEATSGRVGEPSVKADATLTIALPKTGLRSNEARPLIGDLFLGDISVPPELYGRSFPGMGSVAPFVNGHILRIW